MKKKHLLAYSAGTGVLIIFLALGYWYSQHNLSFTCSSSTASFYSNEGEQPFVNFTQNISFNHFGKASVYLSGDLHTQDGQIYPMNRSVFYRYVRIGTSDYRLQVTGEVRSGNDRVPADLDNQYLMPVLEGVSRIFGIRQLPTGDMVISNNAGPYLICAVH
ncbi:TPA: hypothetical protein OOF39_000009 [Kluyvera ascorbata]|nr:hypothetical protein [Kluyvera ascorbata]